jgi:hypothetical protein
VLEVHAVCQQGDSIGNKFGQDKEAGSKSVVLDLAELLQMKEFDYSLDFRAIDFRQHPELYRIGRGEQGVLLVEPYKSEILSYWKFKTPKAILLAWIWHASSCRWGIPALVVMPITSQGASMQQIPKRFYPAKKIRSKLNLPGFFMRSGNWLRLIRSMCD